MLKRSAGKVKASADAARFLHSDVAITKGNITRAAAIKIALDSDKDTSAEKKSQIYL